MLTITDSLIIEGDAFKVLEQIETASVQCIITSPPYWGLRDYGIESQLGLENTLQEYINNLVLVFRESKRVLKDNGVLWINIGDGYTSGNRGYRAPDKKNPARAMSVRPDTPDGLKPKDLLGIPWRLAFALQADGWFLRSDIIWNKPNGMPESVKDRPNRSHEYIFMLTKKEKYFYKADAIKEGDRNKRTVWNVNTKPFPKAHFATFPITLIEPCILSSSSNSDYILDPFFGSGTVGAACLALGRKYIGIELNAQYIDIAKDRLGCNNNNIIKLADI
jgi:site-specific DNA-methyltransferase (cytosine-N4-specific)